MGSDVILEAMLQKSILGRERREAPQLISLSSSSKAHGDERSLQPGNSSSFEPNLTKIV